jgi:ethanolamine permease
LTGLGVAYVIAGLYAVWNYGIGAGGWGGMLAAVAIAALLYFCLIFSLAELATIVPTAGGGYGFARRALGPFAGYVVGIVFLVEYTVVLGALAVFFGAYFHELTGLDGARITLSLYAATLAVHIVKAHESLAVTLALALIAAAGLGLFVLTALPSFSVHRLLDMPVAPSTGASPFLPHGVQGIWFAMPYATAMFLGIEGVPFAAEEARDPRRDLPRGMIAAILVLFVISLAILVVGPGSAGAARFAASPDPIAATLAQVAPDARWIHGCVSLAGLTSIAGAFFAVMFAASRQSFALGRAGYLPRVLARTNRGGAPYVALLAIGAIALPMSLFGDAAHLVVISFACAALAYLLLMASHIRLRWREPRIARPFVTPGGSVTAGIAFALSFVVLAVSVTLDVRETFVAGAVVACFVAYFWLYSRHHVDTTAPEEAGLDPSHHHP